MADARSTNRIDNYAKFWDKDRTNEKAEVQGVRVNNYTEVVNGQLYSIFITFFHLSTKNFWS